MIRSSTNEQFTPFKDPEREFRSSRKHFKTLSLDELRSPDFNLFSDQEYSEEKVTKTMAETMKQYMSKTRPDYGSGVARPKIEDKDNFRGNFSRNYVTPSAVQIMKMRTNTLRKFLRSSRSTETSNGLTSIQAQLNNLGREIKKVNEKVYDAQVGCEQCKGPHYAKDCPLKEEGKTLKEAYYMKFGRPFQGGGYRVAALGFYQRNNTNPSYQDRRKEDLKVYLALLKRTREIKSRRFQLLLKLIHARYAVLDPPNTHIHWTESCTHMGSYGPQFSEAYSEASQSIPQKKKDTGSFSLPSFINNVCFDNALVDLGASVSVMPLLTYLNLGLGELAYTKLTVELADKTVKYPKGIAKNVLVGIGKFVFPIDFIILDMPKDIKVPLILKKPFLSIARAKIDVYKRKITLRVREERIVFTSVKPASSLTKRVYMLSLRERMELNLEARLMGETLVLNRSLNPFFEDYIELNDLNEPFELKRNQGFAVLEDMDAYRDEGMGNVIFGGPFLREVEINAKRFDGMITILIPPLLKVSDEDKMNGISHPYQKLKGFTKEY
nr:hypothetical protein [Tanacetum cinerariifolium]